jgi:hypothetical protein
MIQFKYDIVFGLMFWSIKDIPRVPHYKVTSTLIPKFSGFVHQSHTDVAYHNTQNK